MLINDANENCLEEVNAVADPIENITEEVERA